MSAILTTQARATVLIMSLVVIVCVATTDCEKAPKTTCEPHGTRLEIAVLASLSHHFTTDCLAAPADEPFTIHFENEDTSSHGNHNIHIVLPGEDFVGERAFHGTSITYEVGPLPAGTFEFHCDEHLEMNGTFIVAGSSGPATDASA